MAGACRLVCRESFDDETEYRLNWNIWMFSVFDFFELYIIMRKKRSALIIRSRIQFTFVPSPIRCQVVHESVNVCTGFGIKSRVACYFITFLRLFGVRICVVLKRHLRVNSRISFRTSCEDLRGNIYAQHSTDISDGIAFTRNRKSVNSFRSFPFLRSRNCIAREF